MSPPEDYVQVMDEFMTREVRGVKIDGASRTDAACFKMVAHLKGLPVEVRSLPKKQVVLVRTDL